MRDVGKNLVCLRKLEGKGLGGKTIEIFCYDLKFFLTQGTRRDTFLAVILHAVHHIELSDFTLFISIILRTVFPLLPGLEKIPR